MPIITPTSRLFGKMICYNIRMKKIALVKKALVSDKASLTKALNRAKESRNSATSAMQSWSDTTRNQSEKLVIALETKLIEIEKLLEDLPTDNDLKVNKRISLWSYVEIDLATNRIKLILVTIGFGISIVSRATGLSRTTITTGINEIEKVQDVSNTPQYVRSIRRTGGGRKTVTYNNPAILISLDALVDPVTRGDPESPLRWTCKSLRKLAGELQRQGFQITEGTVSKLLKDKGFSLQSNRKSNEGNQHPDRNAQFEYIRHSVVRIPLSDVRSTKKLPNNINSSHR